MPDAKLAKLIEDEVRSLPHECVKLSDPLLSGNSEKLNKMKMDRRDRHEKACEHYEQQYKAISDDLEKSVLNASDTMKKECEKLFSEISFLLNNLQKETFLIDKDKNFILQIWQQLEALFHIRTNLIEGYGQNLDTIEQCRVTLVREELTKLTNTLLKTGYILLPDVERIIELQSYELNLVVINNRESYAHLLTMLLEEDLQVLVNARLAWEKGEILWRKLRHSHAVTTFKDILHSDAYTNPEERHQIIQQLQQHQSSRHVGQRTTLLKKLGNLEYFQITSSSMDAIFHEFETLQKEEDEENSVYFDLLRNSHDAKMNEIIQLQETLRHDLHSFASNLEEQSLLKFQQRLGEFLNRYGQNLVFGLKNELRTIRDQLGNSGLIYETELGPLIARVEIVVDALNLKDILETQGKLGERKAVLSTLDKLVESKMNWADLLPLLEQQIFHFLQIHDLGSIFKREVEQIHQKLEHLVQELVHLSSSSSSNLLSRNDLSGLPRLPVIMDTLHQNEVRSIRHSLGMLLSITDLPIDFQNELYSLIKSLYHQRDTNQEVDQVIETEFSETLELRKSQGIQFIKRMGVALDRQSSDLHETSERVCKVYYKAAQIVESHAKKINQMDEEFKDTLFNLEHAFSDMNQENELEFEKVLSALRHAPEQQTLENHFAKCLSSLELIEQSYRSYHQSAVTASKMYPEAVEQVEQNYNSALCDFIGLVPRFQKEDDTVLDSSAAVDHQDLDPSTVQNDPHHYQDVNKDIINVDDNNHKSTMDDINVEWCHQVGKNYVSKRGTSYVVKFPIESLVMDLMTFDEDPIVSLITTTTGSQQKQEEKERKKNLVVFSKIEQEIEVQEQEKVEKEQVQEQEKEQEQERMSSIGDGQIVSSSSTTLKSGVVDVDVQEKCLRNSISKETIMTMISQLFNCLINEQEERHFHRNVESNATCTEKVTLLTEELEERLRQHWPRKGRTEFVVCQRRGELESHQQRQERYLGNVLEKNESHENQFQKLLDEFQELCSTYETNQLALQVQLALQGNLASLQGLDMKEKHTRKTFEQVSDLQLKQLQGYCEEDPRHLIHGCQEFVNQCRNQIFPDMMNMDVMNGLDYNQEEVDLLASLMEATGIEIQHFSEKRTLVFMEMKEKKSQLLEKRKAFKKRYQSCLQDLSMREGLGQKYGAPRRISQERLRMEIARSEDSEKKVQSLLVSLQGFSSTSRTTILTRNNPIPTSTAIPTSTSTVIPTSTPTPTAIPLPPRAIPLPPRDILDTLIELKKLIYERAVYLNILKNPEAIALLLFNQVVETNNKVSEKTSASEMMLDIITFNDAVNAIETNCLVATKELYSLEGKAMELPENGIPESLQHYLFEQRNRANRYQEEAIHRFRKQMEEMEDLLMLCPSVALNDLQLRGQEMACEATQAMEAEFEKNYEKWSCLKTRHQNLLTPQLCHPKFARQLQELCQEEAKRAEHVQESLVQVNNQLVHLLEEQAGGFEKQYVDFFCTLVAHLDTCLMVADLKKCLSPDDEAVVVDVSKRKSLKSLRSDLRKKELEKEDVVTSSFDRFPRRKWPGIAKLGTLKVSHVGVEVSAMKEIKEMKEEDSGSCESYLTRPHRALVRGRDEGYQRYSNFFFETTKSIQDKYEHLLQEEIQWVAIWKTMVQSLKEEV